ncbi:MAG TPA: L-threonylcarbamoyladenylate synthase [Usitatibacter sp.]|nr:L-threonylcarbamoyladenylate synthase [Usitatibacter sp.]
MSQAAELLAAGDVVAFPTETVYGLGADAANPAAVAKIFALKGRPSDHPLIVHVLDAAAMSDWAREVPDAARKLAARFWPGPLTMILTRSSRVPSAVTGGQETVGLRCPSHPIAQELLREFARVGSGAIAAPSANKFGHVSPTTAEHVREEFGDAVPVLDGGACDVGIESTIVDLSRGVPVLLRPGAVTRDDIEETLGVTVHDRDEAAPRASGTLAAHYAPRTALVLVTPEGLDREVRSLTNVAVLAMRQAPRNALATAWIAASPMPERYGHDLYANLRRLDSSGAKRILVEAPPDGPEWEAIADRLTRAAAGAAAEEP